MSQCPACNGLTNIRETCPHCGQQLQDVGSRDDFYGPYRTYMSDAHTECSCVHVLYCQDCGSSINWPVPVMM